MTKELRKDEKEYKIESLKNKPKDPTSQWKAVKKILNIKQNQPPTRILNDGEIVTDPAKIAEIMNKAYIRKPMDIVNEIPKTNKDPLINYKKLVEGKKQTLSFELKTINMEDLRKIVRKFKSTTSAGTDSINMKIIKENMKTIEPALLNIVNTSITMNTYPDNLKTQLILPALKPQKDSLKPLSYRPINIIETIGKIIETAVKDQTMEYLTENELIPSQHNGGLPNNSTTTVAIQLIDQWTQLLEEKQDAVNIQLDQTRAFEIVSHKILIKNENTGIQQPNHKMV